MSNVSHHPAIADISSPTNICFGDLKQIPKKGHQSQPLLVGGWATPLKNMS